MKSHITPANSDGAGRPELSAEQEDAWNRHREACAESLRTNRAFVANSIEYGGGMLLATIASAYLSGDLTRATAAIKTKIEADILEVFDRHDNDFDEIKAVWRSFEKEALRPVLPPAGPSSATYARRYEWLRERWGSDQLDTVIDMEISRSGDRKETSA